MSADRRPPAVDEDDDVAARVASILKIGAPLGVVLLAIGMGVVRGAPLAILVLAAGALAAVIALFWQSVRTLVGETPLSGADAFAIAAPRAEEEKKRAVLRALKDLEFERSVGKISETDYDQLVLQYRAEARSLLQQLDDSAKPRRDRVMALVDDRLRRAGLGRGIDEVRDITAASAGGESGAEAVPPAAAVAEVAPEPPREATEEAAGEVGADETAEAEPAAVEASPPREIDEATDKATDKATESASTRATCAACSASNEPDAAFCKKCGAKMSAPAPEVDADAT